MYKTGALTLLAAVGVALAACATVPDKSQLTRLDRGEIQSGIVGNTYTRLTDYGRWAEYLASVDRGYGRASGSWGSESAVARYDIASDGEWCIEYSGDPEWASPEHEYCSVLYTGPEGNYYAESTKDTWEPASEGRISKVEIRPGDEFGLAEQ